MSFSFDSLVLKNIQYDITHEGALALSVPERHLLVSLIPTPEEFIETLEHKGGNEYVKYQYMRELSFFFYGGHSMHLDKQEIVYDPDGNVWVNVIGELRWEENTKWFCGGMCDAHRATYSSGTKSFSDLGDSCKAAVTDLEKKMLNFYLNISDDVYRWTGSMIPNDHREFLLKQLESKKITDATEHIKEAIRAANRLNFLAVAKQIKALEDA